MDVKSSYEDQNQAVKSFLSAVKLDILTRVQWRMTREEMQIATLPGLGLSWCSEQICIDMVKKKKKIRCCFVSLVFD